MTAAPAGPAQLFSMFSGQGDRMYRTRREAFVFSLLGQALIVGLLIYFTCVITATPSLIGKLPNLKELPVVFSGYSGGGGAGLDKIPASQGSLPRALLDDQVVPPTVILPKEPPKLAVEETIRVAPEVKLPQAGQIGDPMSQFSRVFSNGPGGPNGTGHGCCDGVGDWAGPSVGSGPPGFFPRGRRESPCLR